jgi:hypothetical protein
MLSYSVTYANNSAESPWRTVARSAWGSTSFLSPNQSQAARAGDTVLISGGIYWETGNPQGGRFTVSLNPANSGTLAQPIIFREVGSVEIRLTAGVRGGMIGSNGRHSIIWDNFIIDDYYGGSTSDTGPVVFSGNCRNCQIINCLDLNHNGDTTDIIPFGAYITGNEVIGRVPAPAILDAAVGSDDPQVRIWISGTLGATYWLESTTELLSSKLNILTNVLLRTSRSLVLGSNHLDNSGTFYRAISEE